MSELQVGDRVQIPVNMPNEDRTNLEEQMLHGTVDKIENGIVFIELDDGISYVTHANRVVVD